VIVSASPVLCSMKSCGRMATASNQIENAHKIYHASQQPSHPLKLEPLSHFCERVFVREQDREDCACPYKILHLECIEIGIVCRLIFVEHQIDRVSRAADENDLENGIVKRLGFVESPEKIDVSCYVNDEV
jgi:hypothetical protein